ncbi:MAG: hypothetical protein ACFFAK_18855 [Promethearchaeota archaeon]
MENRSSRKYWTNIKYGALQETYLFQFFPKNANIQNPNLDP